MCCKFCVCGQNSVRCDHSNGTSLNGNICFGSLSSLQKGNLFSICVGHFGASLLDQTLSVSALGVKQEPKKAFYFHMLLWYIPCPVKTCFHMITIPLQELLKRFH